MRSKPRSRSGRRAVRGSRARSLALAAALALAPAVPLGAQEAAVPAAQEAAVPAAQPAAPADAAARTAAPAPGTAVPAAPDPRRLSLFPAAVPEAVAAESAPYAEALRAGLRRSLELAGYSVVDEIDPLSGEQAEAKDASSRARESGASWAAVCELSAASGRIVYRIATYDARDGALAAGDGFSAFTGLSAIPLLEGAAARTVEKLGAYESARTSLARRLVGYRLLALCPVEGAGVSVLPPGASSGIVAGRIEGGRLELPYYPFVQGASLTLVAAAPGHHRMSARLELGADRPPAVELAEPRPRFDLLVGTGSGRLMGLGGGIRVYPGSEWLFVFFEDRVYAGYDSVKGSSALWHSELWQGLGLFLFFPPSSRFRLGCSLGCGVLLSALSDTEAADRHFADFALLPAEAFAEYRLNEAFGLWLSMRFAYSVGTSNGLLERGWIGGGPPSLSAGALWRRR
jgi:hypothetical protein